MNYRHLNILLVVVAGSSQLKSQGNMSVPLSYEESVLLKLSPSEARVHEEKVLREVANLTLLPPRLNADPLPEYRSENLDYAMTIGIERTPGGRLFAAWIGGEDGPEAFMVVAKSDDDGDSWSEPILVIDSQTEHLPIPRSVIVGNLWTDPLGRLWLFFDQTMNHFDGRGGLWATVCENPDANELRWSEPTRIWHGSMLNKPTVLTSGEWVLPVQLLDHVKGIGPFKVGVFPELDPLRGANLLVSEDQGKTWTRRGGRKFPEPNWYEHKVIELKDGRLWMLARTQNGIMQSFSSDQGATWGEPTFPNQIKHPVARFHLQRLASGNLLLVKHGKTIDTHEGRSHLTAWLSDDEGRSWKGGLMLDERKVISYPDGFQGPDGKIYVSYDRNRATDGEVWMAQFYEKDVLAGKVVNSDSRLRMPIFRAGAAR